MAISPRASVIASTGGNGLTTLACAKPAGLVAGDVMFGAFCAGNNTGAAISFTLPTGWTAIDTADDNDFTTLHIATVTCYKVADSTDVAASTFTFTQSGGNLRLIACISAYAGVDTTTPYVEHNLAKKTTTDTNRATPALTTAALRWLLEVFTDISNVTITAPDTTRQSTFTSNLAMSVSDTNANVAAGTYTKTATSTGSASQAVCGLIAINPASSTPAPVISFTLAQNVAEYDARATTNATSHTVSPTTGVVEPVDGFFVLPRGSADVVYTHTASGPGGSTTNTFTVLAAASGGARTQWWDQSTSTWKD